MNESEESVSNCIKELVSESIDAACCVNNGSNNFNEPLSETASDQNNESAKNRWETPLCKTIVQRVDDDGESLVKTKESPYANGSHCDVEMVNEDASADPTVSLCSQIDEPDGDENCSHLAMESGETEKPGEDSSKGAGWVFQGEQAGYAYYTDSAGQVYSVDRSGYWYIQEESGDFIPCDSSAGYSNANTKMFPLNDAGLPTLPLNAQGEKVFPTDANHMPIFPIDSKTGIPTFPVDDNGQPIFPTGINGRPIVPVDNNGVAIFPRDENGQFIFPSGTNGIPMAPLNTYGIPVLPLDENGKPVVPYDSNGAPLIHLASDGITPLTQEEYEYSLQWNDYYDKYNQYYCGQQTSQQISSTSAEALEQHEKNLKLLKKVRPEDIDLPPTEPPPPSGPVPVSMTPISAVPQPEPSKEDEKSEAEMRVKAKTKRLLEMQLRFTRKTGLGVAKVVNSAKTAKVNESSSDASDGTIVSAAKSAIGSQEAEPNSGICGTVGCTEVTVAEETTVNVNLPKFVCSPKKMLESGSPARSDPSQGQTECDDANTGTVHGSSKENENPEPVVEGLEVEQRNTDVRGFQSVSRSLENDSADKALRKIVSAEVIVLKEESSQKPKANTESMKPTKTQSGSIRTVKSSISKSDSRTNSSNKENERRCSHSSSGGRRRNGRSLSRRRTSSSRNQRSSVDRERLYSERSYRGYRYRDSRSRSYSCSSRYHSRSPPRRRVSSSRRSRSSPRRSSRSRERSSRDRYSRRERSSSRNRRYVRERSPQKHSRSSSREKSPYYRRSSRHSYWERSSSRRRSRSRDFSTSRRGGSREHSTSREQWSSKRRSRSVSSGRSSRSYASHSDCRAADSRTSVSSHNLERGTGKDAIVRSAERKQSHSKSTTPPQSDLISVRSYVTSKLKSSVKPVTPLSEKSLTEGSGSDEPTSKQKKLRDKKKKKKKKNRKHSSSRRSKEGSAKVQTETINEKDVTKDVQPKQGTCIADIMENSETDPQEPDSYGPHPPKNIPKKGDSEVDRITDLLKNRKPRKDKGDRKKKKKKRKKKSKDSGSEFDDKEMQGDNHGTVEEDDKELDGIEPGEILEQDPSPKSFVDESDGLSVVFIGPKWEANAKNVDATKVNNGNNGATKGASPKIFYTKFIRETMSTPIITFTSNPTMAESFAKLKREFDAADGPRRIVQASKHFQTAMELLNESSENQRNEVMDAPSESTQRENRLPQIVESKSEETVVVSKWKSLEATSRERRERKKAKKERKLRHAHEKEGKHIIEENVAAALAKTQTAQMEEKQNDFKVTTAEEEAGLEVDAAASKKNEVVTESGGSVRPMNDAKIADTDKQGICTAQDAQTVTEKAIIMTISEVAVQPRAETESIVETDTHLATHLTQPSIDDNIVNDSVNRTSVTNEGIPQRSVNRIGVNVNELMGASTSTSGRGDKGTQADDDAARRKEILKRKLEEEEEDELSRLRYEALRSKTRRLMNDLRTERRRLKRERLRATLAMRRARGYDDDISVDDLLMADSSETSDTDDSGASNRASRKNAKRRLIKRTRIGGERHNRYRSLGIHDEEVCDSLTQRVDEHLLSANTVGMHRSSLPVITGSSSHNDLISELRNRIGGTNKSALQLLEQLRRSLTTNRGVNIHLNPELIRNSP